MPFPQMTDLYKQHSYTTEFKIDGYSQTDLGSFPLVCYQDVTHVGDIPETCSEHTKLIFQTCPTHIPNMSK